MPGSPDRRFRLSATVVDRTMIAVIAAVFGIVGYAHRWITDDGLIFLRIARQIAAGHGPVTNSGERVEAATSTLWVWILGALTWMFGIRDPAPLAVYLGLALAIAGVVIALAATRRLHRTLAPDTALVPAGALVLLVLPPFWNYATAGMETGLELAWGAAWWWLLVDLWRRDRDGQPVRLRRWLAVGAFFGLGPLVRPDFAILSAVGLVAALLLTHAGWRRWLLTGAAAGVVPVGYQIFRMGYYGLPYPMPAAAKGASSSLWWRGWLYVLNYGKPYALYVPLALALAAATAALWPHREQRRNVVVFGAPIAGAVAESLYVVKVGGDFMHGRMWLIPTLFAVAPVLLVPARRVLVAAAAGLAVWAGIGVFTFADAGKITLNPHRRTSHFQGWIWEERVNYVTWTHRQHPTRTAQHVDGNPALPAAIRKARATGQRVLVFDPEYIPHGPLPLSRHADGDVGIMIGRLGAGGGAVGLDDTVVDVFGLSNPIGAFIPAKLNEPAGHQKLLPVVWNIALYTDARDDNRILPLVRDMGISPGSLAAARHTLRCGAVKELLDAESAPLTFDRFFDNLTGAMGRSSLTIPADPRQAERKFCGRPSRPRSAR
jgi:arabinofuranosyltransferase